MPPPTSGGIQQIKFDKESNVYSLVMKSKMPEAEMFQDWVCDEVLPSIRSHGIYATSMTVDKILENPDFLIDLLQKYKEGKAKEAILTQQKMEAELKVEEASKEIARCDCTITQLTEKVDVNDMRQTLNDIVRNAPGETFGTAWQHLYREFQKKYHLNIYSRKNYEKYDNLLDYIDKELHMIPELYELACALYSVAYEKVKSRWERGTKSGNVSFASRVNR